MAEEKSCSLRVISECSKEDNYKSVELFSDRQLFLIKKRSGNENLESVCLKHEKFFLTFYPIKQNKCCDPLNIHKTPMKSTLWTITEDFETIHNDFSPSIVEGNITLFFTNENILYI